MRRVEPTPTPTAPPERTPTDPAGTNRGRRLAELFSNSTWTAGGRVQRQRARETGVGGHWCGCFGVVCRQNGSSARTRPGGTRDAATRQPLENATPRDSNILCSTPSANGAASTGLLDSGANETPATLAAAPAFPGRWSAHSPTTRKRAPFCVLHLEIFDSYLNTARPAPTSQPPRRTFRQPFPLLNSTPVLS
ncbi:hypothetical protein EJ04DRAFT_180121 [Polyplosphaeria fusca]|uniref:Uncharacterized protein n=1 Tax=Polyplosphaeria fusca TaxID=682080 RepID=A0A9P4QZQ9_9PLEO|nr:hypothetical protein EJ04DRAFT_180121 [Polyplosphaeria fusca]